MNKILKLVNKLPKTDIHIHLDGSLFPEFIAEKAAERKMSLPAQPD